MWDGVGQYALFMLTREKLPIYCHVVVLTAQIESAWRMPQWKGYHHPEC